MQPYQEAAQATRQSGEIPLNAIKYGAGIALGTAGSMIAKEAINKMVPLLSSFVPESFAKKALSKIDPRIGKFINKSEGEGFSFEEIKDFLQQKIQKSEIENPKQNKNIIEQYSPELYQFIQGQIQNGRSPIEAAALAQMETTGNKFRSIINKMTKDHKTDWSAIVSSIFGEEGIQKAHPQTQQSAQQQQTSDKWNQIASQLQNLLKS